MRIGATGVYCVAELRIGGGDQAL